MKKSNLPGRFDTLAIPTPGKKRKPVVRSTKPEKQIQDSVEAYLRLRGLAYFHLPDALLKAGFSHGSAINFALINAARDVRGFPDLLIFDERRQGEVLCVELKTETGKMSVNQKDWQRVLGTKLARSFEEAKVFIDEWMENKQQGGK